MRTITAAGGRNHRRHAAFNATVSGKDEACGAPMRTGTSAAVGDRYNLHRATLVTTTVDGRH
jgi:hypothetical protein